MGAETEFLDYIYQNASMGVASVETLLKDDHSPAFTLQLASQLREYKDVCDKAHNLLAQYGKKQKDKPVAQLSLKSMIALEKLTNKSDSHIAEMMIKGSSMGIIDIIKKQKEYGDCPKDIASLATTLLNFESDNIEKLKSYL